MSVREIKAWTITCTSAYGGASDQPRCMNRKLGPFFAEYGSQVPLPKGWGYRTSHDCGLTGYTSRDLFCGECIERYEITIDPEDQR